MISQFISDVREYEGDEIANKTKELLATPPSPCLALFYAKRELSKYDNLFCIKFNSRKE